MDSVDFGSFSRFKPSVQIRSALLRKRAERHLILHYKEACADVILSAAAFRVILTGGGGAPIDFFRRQLNAGGGGVRRRDRQ